METTYTVTNPVPKSLKHAYRYTPEQVVVADNAKAESKKILIDFAHAVFKHFDKDWTITTERHEGLYRDTYYLNIENGERLVMDVKFDEKFLTITNHQYNSRYSRKLFTRINYDTPLTIEKQGEKLFKVLNDQVQYHEKDKAKKSGEEYNKDLAVKVLDYLVDNHGLSRRQKDPEYPMSDRLVGDGWSVSYDSDSISLIQYLNDNQISFTYYPNREENQLEMDLEISSYSKLNLHGSYNSLEKFAEKLALVNAYTERANNLFAVMLVALPEAVNAVK